MNPWNFINLSHTCIPLLNTHLKSSVSYLEPTGFFSSSQLLTTTIPNISFSRVLVPDLAWCSKNLLLNFSTKFCPSYCLVTIPTSPNTSNLFFSASFSSRTFHILQILSPELLSGDQGYHSSSLEACQDHQKLNSITSFPCFTAYFTNSIP